MQTWNLAAGDPLSLTLAADARLAETDYTDDQTWELSLGGGEPAALALQTTFGLRAHWMRLFPRFTRSETGKGEVSRLDPAGFHAPPRITTFYPNYLSLIFEPFEGLEVQAEYRVLESHIIAGRLRLTNRSILPQNFRLEWAALLNPIDRQGGMVGTQIGPSAILEGETSYLHPVVVLTGGPKALSGPYPGLAHDIELYPGNERLLSWACASLRSYETSFEAARMATARPWEAEQTRVDLTNFSQSVAFETGNPEWDAALAFSQNAAFELLLKNPTCLPNASFVLTRRPDQGFSVRGDGNDHTHLWGGQTALDTSYLASLLLPGGAEVVAGILRNFLSAQDENGLIDWKIGLGGQRSSTLANRRLAQPLLAALAVQVAPYMPQPAWYREVFPGLLRFFNAWFSPANDRDEDGFPEWEHPLQTGIEDSPIFDRWSPNAQGINIQRLESPSLAAMLLRECRSLVEIAEALAEAEKVDSAYARLSGAEPGMANLSGAEAALQELRAREAALLEALQGTWDEKAKIYRYRDYASHISTPGAVLVEVTGPGKASSRKRFSQPRRLIVHLKLREERSYAITCTIHGFTADGEVTETLDSRSFSWMGRQARATSENIFLAMKRIEVQGLGEEDQMRVLTADYTQEDCSLFLPLWAGAPTPQQAVQLVEDSLLPRYFQPYGIPLCPPDALLQDSLPGMPNATTSALLPWNDMIGEGLLRYGYRTQAADLFTRLMNAIIPALKDGQAFRQYYHAETGQAAGEKGHLHGLAPVGLFLKILGIQEITAKSILLDGFSAFPGVIQVKYHKVCITCHPDKTEIRFPGGQCVTIDRPGIHRVSLC